MSLPTPALWPLWSSESPPPGSLDLLNALRDIREPAAPGWWPPAPGWWLLGALLLTVLLLLGLRAWRRRRRQRPIRRALEELESWRQHAAARSDSEAASELAALLKRAALVHYPRASVARLSGDAWLAFLDDSGDTDRFSQGAGRALGDRRYAPTLEFDAETLAALARGWLLQHLDGPSHKPSPRLKEAGA